MIKKHRYLGRFDNEIDAAKARDIYIVQNCLDHIDLNFPKNIKEYQNSKYIPIKKKKPASKYIGVYKHRGKFCVRVKIGKKVYHLGMFVDEIKAAKKYDKYVADNNIQNRTLNFPNEHPEYKQEKKIKTHCKEIDSFTVKLLLNNSKDSDVIIDREDYDKIKYHSCHICKRGYVNITIKSKNQRLHRFLLEVKDSHVYVDHINNNKLNNTKKNLRLSNAQKNARNKSKKKGTPSKYIGVYRKGLKWETNIKFNYNHVYWKSNKDEELVARARDLFILDNLKNEHYKLNFEWSKKEIKEWKDKLQINQ